MIYDTNLIIGHIRKKELLPARAVILFVVVGELEAFALKADWGMQKGQFLHYLIGLNPIADLEQEIIPQYAQIDAYSQNKLRHLPLPAGLTARNLGKNDLWIAATALYLGMELHTTDNDFDHLSTLGLKLVKRRV